MKSPEKTNLETFLEFYSKFYSNEHAPGYAVLVTGAWGVGKTFQVKKCIKEEDRIYVSLYGVQSVEQIHAEVLAEAYPVARKYRLFEVFRGKVAGAAGTIVPLDLIPDVASAYLRNKLTAEKILVFDDLDRNNMELSIVLGAINSYVEHSGFRVVIIAHETENLLSEKYNSLKEKTIGHTIQVEPDTVSALDQFIDRVHGKDTKNFLTKHKSRIRDVFHQSGAKSLRILKHVIEDLARLHEALEDNHKKHLEAMNELVLSFIALGIEIRANNIGKGDIRNRWKNLESERVTTGDESRQKQPFIIAEKKYPDVKLRTDMLNDEILVEMFVNGKYPMEDIRASIDCSRFFLSQEEYPPWKAIIYLDVLDERQLDEAHKQMEAQFQKRYIRNPGEMLHVFALRLIMVEHEILKNKSYENIVNECKKYIDDLSQSNDLPKVLPGSDWYESISESYAGYNYWISARSAEHFSEVRKALKDKCEEAFYSSLPNYLDELLHDEVKFGEEITVTYANLPILHNMNVTNFADILLNKDPDKQRHILLSLKKRYSNEQLMEPLNEEKEWVSKLIDELNTRYKNENGFTKLYIKRLANDLANLIS